MTTVQQIRDQMRALEQGDIIAVKIIDVGHPLAECVKDWHLGRTYTMTFDRLAPQLQSDQDVRKRRLTKAMVDPISVMIWGRGDSSQITELIEAPVVGFGFHDWLVDEIKVLG